MCDKNCDRCEQAQIIECHKNIKRANSGCCDAIVDLVHGKYVCVLCQKEVSKYYRPYSLVFGK